MKYEILEHRADLKIRAFGKTKEELFSNMLSGMSENMKPELQKPGEKTKRKIKLSSFDFQALLVDFLSEILYLSQVNKEVFFEAKFKKFSENEGEEDKSSSSPKRASAKIKEENKVLFASTAAWEIEGEIFGQKAERFGEDIKAVTYHNLEIKKTKNKTWEATVLFDI